MNQMVNFPSGSPYRDSGEGGLFVMMVVPEPDNFSHNCHVDGIIVISAVDVEVTRSCIWESYDYHSSNRQRRRQMEEVMKKNGDDDLRIWSSMLLLPEEFSDSLLFAAHMGSTHHSLWNEKVGAYFAATKDDLTYEGRILYEAVKVAYGTDPLLITCLDT